MRLPFERRGRFVQIDDTYALEQAVGEITLSIVTPCAVDMSRPGLLQLKERTILGDRVSGQGQLSYDANVFRVAIEQIAITDERLGGTWGESLWCVVLRAERPVTSAHWVFRFSR